MNDNELSIWQNGIGISISKISRIIGALFILILLVPILNWTLILSDFISEDNALRTAQNILANESLFRLNIINQILTAIIILLLSFLLYGLLKTANRNLALLGFTFRFIELILTLVIAFGHFILVLTVKDQSLWTLNEPEILSVIELILKNHIQITAIPGIFFALGMVIFSYLFLISKIIPKKLSLFGIISYLLICIYDTAGIRFPGFTELVITQIIFTVPMCIFQITIGIRLLIKGIGK